MDKSTWMMIGRKRPVWLAVTHKCLVALASQIRWRFFQEVPLNSRPCRSRNPFILCRDARRSFTMAKRSRTRSRIASWVWSGTQTDVSSPVRDRRAKMIASRRSVLIRSPGLRRVYPGETTSQ